MDDLYNRPIDGAEFTKFCGGNVGGEHETCIEFAQIPGTTDGFVLRDTKPAGAGLHLRATVSELDNFALGWAKSRRLT
ncbi:DUF397 domain-containing protein [Streptomyces sp. ISL-36]|uniref:DUF397 domain-containing protein n=1 Tax=Streptomyces sp. ISL-36 TaxID=2819182 RepID=UPI001BE7E4A1|nr:DUF397 domain-containing protein [Streptomyces sp. ISL-36]MBT2445044.1 DUF397 domain-containing protein [Streptomyces sp. ISL-36]